MFSKRTGWDLTPNRLSETLSKLRAAGEEVIDLTESNPTRVGLRYPEGLLNELARPEALLYEPDPRGRAETRRAVAELFAAKGARVEPDRVFLTASTSEAYSMLFRLLADPGDVVLTPRPSYPLFGYLAGLNDLETVSYGLQPGPDGWRVDLDELEAKLGPRTRAIVAVHPNNPTGSGLTAAEAKRISELCAARGAALIADEVFAEYLRPESAAPKTLLGEGCLMFALGGLSKWMGLPQMKLSWIACAGPRPQLDDAAARLELVADTLLSVNTPVQAAFPRWAAWAPEVQRQIRERVASNRARLHAALRGGARLLPADGGWNAVLELPWVKEEEAWVVRLLEERKVLAHPGYFYDFEREGTAVVSLLPPPELFQAGVAKLMESDT